MSETPATMASELNAAAHQIESDTCRQGIDWDAMAAFLRAAATMLTGAFFSPWMTAGEAARYARVSVRTLEGYRRTGGEGPVYHRQGGKVVFYHKDDIDAWRAKGRAANTLQERLAGVKLSSGISNGNGSNS